MSLTMAEEKSPLLLQEEGNGFQKTDPRVECSEGASAAPEPSSWLQRVGSSTFYCVGSFIITLSNKAVLTSYGFPSAHVLGLCQLVTTVVVLLAAKLLGAVRIPWLDFQVFQQVWPLPSLFLGNLLFGLGGMQFLSLPIFIALRRFTIVMTMAAEVVLLRKVPSKGVLTAVVIMTSGAVLAAANDLNVTLVGVIYVFMNNLCSAAQVVYVKSCLPHLGQYGVLFYNALLALPPTLLLVCLTGGVQQATDFELWPELDFVAVFATSCLMGAVLQYSVILCVHHNSPLTASIMGSVKNVSVTYVGMFVGGDYIFTLLNFTGLNISVMGTLTYLWLTFGRKK